MREDEFFTPKPQQGEGVGLSPSQREALSIDELEARIAALESEIAACRASIQAKQAQRSAADALFGKSKP